VCDTKNFLQSEAKKFMENFTFLPLSKKVHPDVLDESPDLDPLLRVLLEQDPDKKRKILSEAGAPADIRGSNYTIHDISKLSKRSGKRNSKPKKKNTGGSFGDDYLPFKA
jgi:hypothetical protein